MSRQWFFDCGSQHSPDRRKRSKAPVLVGGVYAPAKIANLYLSVHSQQQVFRLDVAMYYIFRMQIRQTVCNLPDVLSSARDTEQAEE